jgi:hypothetical protein
MGISAGLPPLVNSLNGQTGDILTTDLYAIGSHTIGRPANTANYSVGTTVAGSSLYGLATGGVRIAAGFTFLSLGGVQGVGATLVGVGTWRCISPCAYNGLYQYGYSGLWVRIS